MGNSAELPRGVAEYPPGVATGAVLSVAVVSRGSSGGDELVCHGWSAGGQGAVSGCEFAPGFQRGRVSVVSASCRVLAWAKPQMACGRGRVATPGLKFAAVFRVPKSDPANGRTPAELAQ